MKVWNILTSLSGSLSWKPTDTNKNSWVKKRFQTDFQLLCTYCIHVYLVPIESIFHWLNAYYIIFFVQSISMKQISKIDFDPSNGGQEPRSRGTCQSKGSITLQSTEHLTNNGDPSINRTVPTGDRRAVSPNAPQPPNKTSKRFVNSRWTLSI